MQEAVLTPGECVAVFGRSRKFWRNAMDKGHVRGVMNGSHRLLNRVDCENYIAGTFDVRSKHIPWPVRCAAMKKRHGI